MVSEYCWPCDRLADELCDDCKEAVARSRRLNEDFNNEQDEESESEQSE